jgi:hypothetical protein
VEARKLISRLLADMGGKGGQRTRIAGLQFGKGVQVARCPGIIGLLRAERFEHSQWFGFAPEHKVAHRTTKKLWYFLRNSRADANPRAELLVGLFETSGNVDRIAIRCVVEKTSATEVPDDRRTGVNANARGPECDSFCAATLTEDFGVFVERQCA